MDLFNSLMKDAPAPSEDQAMDFESDLIAQEIESQMEVAQTENPLMGEEDALTKEQRDCFALIRAAALGEATPADVQLDFILSLDKICAARWNAYKGYQIKFIMDLLNKCADLTHTHRDGLGGVKCMITGKTYPEQQVSYLVATLSRGNIKPREVPIHKPMLPICYCLFYVSHFREHLTSRVKGEPTISVAGVKRDFDWLDRSLAYLDHHLPAQIDAPFAVLEP